MVNKNDNHLNYKRFALLGIGIVVVGLIICEILDVILANVFGW